MEWAQNSNILNGFMQHCIWGALCHQFQGICLVKYIVNHINTNLLGRVSFPLKKKKNCKTFQALIICSNECVSHFSFQDKYLRPKLDLLICDLHTKSNRSHGGPDWCSVKSFHVPKRGKPISRSGANQSTKIFINAST